MRPPHANPFRVDRVAALAFVGLDVGGLTTRFEALGRAAIVGPHGAGKSTLLRAIAHELARRGRPGVRIGLPGSATATQRHDAAKTCIAAAVPVFFDGYEQLRWRERRALTRQGRLLATTHRRSALPTLVTLRPTAATLDVVLQQVLVDVSPATRATAQAVFARHRGDVRATLMDLYDAWADGVIDGDAATIVAHISIPGEVMQVGAV